MTDWADVIGFEFQELDPNAVFACILGQSLHPAVRERHDGHRLRNQLDYYLGTGIAPTDIPDFRIAVHGDLLFAAVVRVLGGPCTSEHETRLALVRGAGSSATNPPTGTSTRTDSTGEECRAIGAVLLCCRDPPTCRSRPVASRYDARESHR